LETIVFARELTLGGPVLEKPSDQDSSSVPNRTPKFSVDVKFFPADSEVFKEEMRKLQRQRLVSSTPRPSSVPPSLLDYYSILGDAVLLVLGAVYLGYHRVQGWLGQIRDDSDLIDELRLENRWLMERATQMGIEFQKQIKALKRQELDRTRFCFKKMVALEKDIASLEVYKEQNFALMDLCQSFAQLAEKFHNDNRLLEDHVKKLQEDELEIM
jgi:hypothetical protein